MKCFATALILLGLTATPGFSQEAARKLSAARQAEAAGDSLNAFFLYSRAAELNPADTAASMQSNLLGTRLLQTAVTGVGLEPVDLLRRDQSPEVLAANRIALLGLSPSEAMESAPAAPAPRLKASTERKSFDIRGSVRPVIEEVTRGYGIQTLYEPTFQATATAAINFHVENLTRDEALRSLEAATNTFVVPLRNDTVMVFRDTTENRNNNTASVTTVIPIPQRMNVQEAQELASGVQQIMELRRIAVDAGRHILILRDQEYKIIAARRMILDLMRLRAQVQVDVELLLVSRNSSLSYGLSLPNMWQALSLNNPIRLSTLGRISTSWFGLGIAEATAVATLTRSSSQASLQSTLTALDGQEAQLHIGDQYPVVTGRSSFGTDASTPITQYRDLGLNVRLTPVVHSGGEITLTIEAEYSGLTGGSNDGIPIISTRKFNATTRMKTNEWAVIDGLATSSTSYQTDGIAGLANMPVLGHLFRRDTKSEDAGQILLIIKPHIVSEPVWERPGSAVWMGTETKPPTFY